MKTKFTQFLIVILITLNSCDLMEEPEDEIVRVWFRDVQGNNTVSIMNTSEETYNISRWTIGNEENPKAYVIPGRQIMEPLDILHFTVNFNINIEGYTIYLHDKQGSMVYKRKYTSDELESIYDL